MQKKTATARTWSPTCAAEIKAWFASVIWWCMFKTFSFTQFYEFVFSCDRIKLWFSTFQRWAQFKRFLKLSDPHLDPDHVQDKTWKIKELWTVYLNACKANFWPSENIAIDEAIKNVLHLVVPQAQCVHSHKWL
jgi:hypothetical protein